MKNNAEFIGAIDTIIDGLEALKKCVSTEVVSTEEPSVAVTPIVEESTIPTVVDEATLKSMKYNEFKKYAAQLGVKCTGTRDEIMQRILEATSVESIPEVAESKMAEDDVEEELVDEEQVEETTEEDPYIAQANAILEETDVQDVIEALASVEVKANKKNVAEKLANALRDGLIELEDEEVEEEPEDEDEEDEIEDIVVGEDTDEEDDSEDEDEFSVSAEDYYSEFDPEGFNDPETMTDERKSAILKFMEETIDNFSEDSVEEMLGVITDMSTEEEVEALGEEPDEVATYKMFVELNKRFIDNDGESHEPSEPYEVGEHLMCCGHELKYSKKTKKYICEICGEEYEEE